MRQAPTAAQVEEFLKACNAPERKNVPERVDSAMKRTGKRGGIEHDAYNFDLLRELNCNVYGCCL